MKKKLSLTKSKIQQLTRFVDKFSQARIMVIGDFILDQYIWGNVSRISPEAPVPVVDVKRETYVAGGALNAANNIREFAATVYPCGVVGRDLIGRMLYKLIKTQGIEMGGVIIDTDRPTTLKTRVIAHSQQVVRFDRESKEDVAKKDKKKILEFCRKKMKHVDGVIVEDYGKGVVAPDLLRDIVRLAKDNNAFVAVDPKEKHFKYYKNVTIITPNKKEAFGAVGIALDDKRYSIDDVGHMLLKKVGCKAVLMTLGEEGMALYVRNGDIWKIPTAAKEVFEVSGAGDTVIAVLSLALAAGADYQDAALLANLAAGVVVGKVGTATVSKEELLASLAQ